MSVEIVKMRANLDYPVIPDNLLEVLESYFKMTHFLNSSTDSFKVVDIDNSLDIYWPIPYIFWSALPLVPIINQLTLRFDGGPSRKHEMALLWLQNGSSIPSSFSSFSSSSSSSSSSIKSNQKIKVPNVNEPPATAIDQAYQADHDIIEIGIFGGHMNNHPVGQIVLYRLLVLTLIQFNYSK